VTTPHALTVAAQVFMPVAVGVIMFCLGLELRPADFSRQFARPVGLAASVACQLAVLPIAAFFVATALSLDPILTAGLMLVSACPPSAPVGLLARLSKGDVAGALTLTALAAPVAAATVPPALRLAHYLPPEGARLHFLLLRAAIGITVIVTVPVASGVVLRAVFPDRARRVQPAAIRVAVAVFLVGLVLAIAAVWTVIPSSFLHAGVAAALVNGLGIVAAYALSALRWGEPAPRVGFVLASTTRQFTVASFVALTVCRDGRLLVPAVAYCLIMWAGAAACVVYTRLRDPARRQPSTAAAGADASLRSA
jgi:BASS family bile acid:Na+ symporter